MEYHYCYECFNSFKGCGILLPPLVTLCQSVSAFTGSFWLRMQIYFMVAVLYLAVMLISATIFFDCVQVRIKKILCSGLRREMGIKSNKAVIGSLFCCLHINWSYILQMSFWQTVKDCSMTEQLPSAWAVVLDQSVSYLWWIAGCVVLNTVLCSLQYFLHFLVSSIQSWRWEGWENITLLLTRLP